MKAKVYNAEQAAELTGRKAVTVRAIATRTAGSKKPIGQQIGVVWLFDDADIKRIKQINGEGGRPRTTSVARHRWGPETDGVRYCKNCGQESRLDVETGRWSLAPEPCK